MRLSKCMMVGFWLVLSSTALDKANASSADINTLISGVRALGYEIPEFGQISESCDGDAMCAARFLRDSIGPGAVIIPASLAPPVRTGWRDQKAPMRIIPDPSTGAIKIEFVRFDGAFLSRLLSRLAIIPKKMILDVRGVEMTDDLGEVRRTASLFTGRQERAFRLIHATGREVDWQIPKANMIWPDEDIVVQIHSESPGNGLAFAAILKRYADARIKGGILPDQIFLHHRVPVMHGWEMLVPSGEIVLPK